MSTTHQRYKKNIINRMGGCSQYNILIFGLAERLIEDPALKHFYRSTGIKRLCQMQKEVLDMALKEMRGDKRKNFYNQVMLHHYGLFAAGWNETHFDRIQTHLTEALQSAWTEQDVIDDILFCFEELRDDFFGINGYYSCVQNSLDQGNDLVLQLEASLAAACH